jgi:hypothetical protein
MPNSMLLPLRVKSLDSLRIFGAPVRRSICETASKTVKSLGLVLLSFSHFSAAVWQVRRHSTSSSALHMLQTSAR